MLGSLERSQIFLTQYGINIIIVANMFGNIRQKFLVIQ